uniref:Uncharacterized protein n=1 Tax=Erythrolobus madagascarensis TaxID=708628 RepID=A0A7S0T510_9RHOD
MEKLGVNGAVATGDKHRGAVVSVVWDGADCFATAGADHIARIYQLHPSSNNNPRSTRLIREWTPFHSNTALAGLVSSSPAHDYQHPHDNSDHRARLLLAFGASPQAIVCSWRDGNQLCATPRGDMYAFDSRNTAGHSAAITAAAWTAPRFVTASRDATLRVWEFAGSCSAAARQVRVVRLRAGGTASSRLLPDAIAAAPTSLVAVGCANSSIRVYDLRAHGDRACETIPRAVNAGGDELVSMAFAPDDAHQLLARSTDDCLRLWDIRRVDHPLVCHSNLPSSPPPLASPCLFIHRAPFCSPSSPSSSLSLYATAAAGAAGFAGAQAAHNRNELVKRSRLVLFSRATLELVAEAYVGEPRGNITALCDAARCLMLGCADGTTLQCNSTAATLNAERNRDETICVKSASVQAARQVKDGSSSASPGMQRRRKQHDAVIAKAELPIFAAHEIPAAMRALKKRKHPHASPSTE